jgi:hypothetical protein
LIAKKYSKAQDGTVVAVPESRSQSHTIPFETVRGYIAIVYGDHWWLGCVLENMKRMKNLKSDPSSTQTISLLCVLISAR